MPESRSLTPGLWWFCDIFVRYIPRFVIRLRIGLLKIEIEKPGRSVMRWEFIQLVRAISASGQVVKDTSGGVPLSGIRDPELIPI